MTTTAKEVIDEKNNMEKQMGCMAGFFQLFDRHHILSGKRLYSPKRLPPSPPVEDSKSETKTETEAETTNVSKQPEKEIAKTTMSPLPEPSTPTKSPILPVFEVKEGTKSSWKFAPRLSLDSRAIVDAKGTLHPRDIRTKNNNGEEADDCENQRKSPSVIARLMGLDTLNNNNNNNNYNKDSEVGSVRAPQLRRSASESRVRREVLNYQFIDPSSFKLKQNQQQQQRKNAVGSERRNVGITRGGDLKECNLRNVRTENHRVLKPGGVLQRKSFFDAADFFPEPKQRQQQCVSIYGEIERRLKMRGIDEPSSKDLESLKHILEALQLKGLLHSKNYNSRSNLNVVYERDESPIIVMKPGRPRSPVRNGGARRNIDNTRGRTSLSTGSESTVKSSSSPTIRQRRQLSIETRRRVNETMAERQRRSSSCSSPGAGVRSPRTRAGQGGQISSRSPRNRKSTGEIYSSAKEKSTMLGAAAECDESSTLSDTISSCSQTDTERLSKSEEYREGRSLLERCDKLLHSIAEMTTAELQPSPVSVLDSSFYNEESSPSPVLKRSLEFKELPVELDDDIWSPTISEHTKEDADFVYISEVLRAWKYLPEDSDVFSLLEKQQLIKGRDTSKVSVLERKLIFDNINEIVTRKRQLPAWKATANSNLSPLEQIWSEFQKTRERDTSEQGDMFEVICGVLKKDLSGDAINGWGDCPMEMSEAVLDIERLIFKDLIGETIRDLAAFFVNCNKVSVSRRKLVF